MICMNLVAFNWYIVLDRIMESYLYIAKVELRVAYEMLWLMNLHLCAWWILKFIKYMGSTKMSLLAYLKDFYAYIILTKTFVLTHIFTYFYKCRVRLLRCASLIVQSLDWFSPLFYRVIMDEGRELFISSFFLTFYLDTML